MKIMSNCSDCWLCSCGDGGCLAGIGDDDFVPATKEQLINRLNSNKFSKYEKEIINYLKEQYNCIYNK